MKENNILYKDYKKEVNSQYGEDGMIEEVFKRLNITSGAVVDIGASDGVWFSNTFELLKRGFDVYGVEISDNADKMFKLKETYPTIHPIKVGVEKSKDAENHINKILDRLNVPTEVELMSIDIDSIDPWVFEDCNRNVKLYILEIEPRYYPLDMKYHNPEGNRETNPPQNLTGFGPMYDIAKKKGYTLIGMSVNNLFFLRSDLVETLNWPELVGKSDLENFNPSYLSTEDKERWEEYDNI